MVLEERSQKLQIIDTKPTDTKPVIFDYIVLPGITFQGETHYPPLIGTVYSRNPGRSRCFRYSHQNPNSNPHQQRNFHPWFTKSLTREQISVVRYTSHRRDETLAFYPLTSVKEQQTSRYPATSLSWQTVDKNHCFEKRPDLDPQKASGPPLCQTNLRKSSSFTNSLTAQRQHSRTGSADRLKREIHLSTEQDVLGSEFSLEELTAQNLCHESLDSLVVTYAMNEPKAVVGVSKRQGNQSSEEFDPLYNQAFQFARNRGYGFVKFVNELSDRASCASHRRKHGALPHFFNDRFNPVHFKKTFPKPFREYHSRCSGRKMLNDEQSLSSHMFLESVKEDIAMVKKLSSELDKISIDYKLAEVSSPNLRNRRRHKRQSKIDDPRRSSEASVDRIKKGEKKTFEFDDDMIMFAPYDEYKAYLSQRFNRICEDLANRRENTNATGQNPINVFAPENKQPVKRYSFTNIASPDRNKCVDLQAVASAPEYTHKGTHMKPFSQKRRKNAGCKALIRRNVSRNNSPDGAAALETSKCELESPHEEETRLPSLGEKTSLKYKLCNSLSSTIFRETQLAHKNGAGKAGGLPVVKIDLIHMTDEQMANDNGRVDVSTVFGFKPRTNATVRKPLPTHDAEDANSGARKCCFRKGGSLGLHVTQSQRGHSSNKTYYKRDGDKGGSCPNLAIYGPRFGKRVKRHVCKSPSSSGRANVSSFVGDSPTKNEVASHSHLNISSPARGDGIMYEARDLCISNKLSVEDSCQCHSSNESANNLVSVADISHGKSTSARHYISFSSTPDDDDNDNAEDGELCSRTSDSSPPRYALSHKEATSVNNEDKTSLCCISGSDNAGHCSHSYVQDTEKESQLAANTNNSALPQVSMSPEKSNPRICTQNNVILSPIRQRQQSSPAGLKPTDINEQTLRLPLLPSAHIFSCGVANQSDAKNQENFNSNRCAAMDKTGRKESKDSEPAKLPELPNSLEFTPTSFDKRPSGNSVGKHYKKRPPRLSPVHSKISETCRESKDQIGPAPPSWTRTLDGVILNKSYVISRVEESEKKLKESSVQFPSVTGSGSVKCAENCKELDEGLSFNANENNHVRPAISGKKYGLPHLPLFTEATFPSYQCIARPTFSCRSPEFAVRRQGKEAVRQTIGKKMESLSYPSVCDEESNPMTDNSNNNAKGTRWRYTTLSDNESVITAYSSSQTLVESIQSDCSTHSQLQRAAISTTSNDEAAHNRNHRLTFPQVTGEISESTISTSENLEAELLVLVKEMNENMSASETWTNPHRVKSAHSYPNLNGSNPSRKLQHVQQKIGRCISQNQARAPENSKRRCIRSHYVSRGIHQHMSEDSAHPNVNNQMEENSAISDWQTTQPSNLRNLAAGQGSNIWDMLKHLDAKWLQSHKDLNNKMRLLSENVNHGLESLRNTFEDRFQRMCSLIQRSNNENTGENCVDPEQTESPQLVTNRDSIQLNTRQAKLRKPIYAFPLIVSKYTKEVKPAEECGCKSDQGESYYSSTKTFPTIQFNEVQQKSCDKLSEHSCCPHCNSDSSSRDRTPFMLTPRAGRPQPEKLETSMKSLEKSTISRVPDQSAFLSKSQSPPKSGTKAKRKKESPSPNYRRIKQRKKTVDRPSIMCCEPQGRNGNSHYNWTKHSRSCRRRHKMDSTAFCNKSLPVILPPKEKPPKLAKKSQTRKSSYVVRSKSTRPKARQRTRVGRRNGRRSGILCTSEDKSTKTSKAKRVRFSVKSNVGRKRRRKKLRSPPLRGSNKRVFGKRNKCFHNCLAQINPAVSPRDEITTPLSSPLMNEIQLKSRSLRRNSKQPTYGRKGRDNHSTRIGSYARTGRRKQSTESATYVLGPRGHETLYKLFKKRYEALRRQVAKKSHKASSSPIMYTISSTGMLVNQFRSLIRHFPVRRLRVLQNILQQYRWGRPCRKTPSQARPDIFLESGSSRRIKAAASSSIQSSENNACKLYQPFNPEIWPESHPQMDKSAPSNLTYTDMCSTKNATYTYQTVNQPPTNANGDETVNADDCSDEDQDMGPRPVDSMNLIRRYLSKSKNSSKNACGPVKSQVYHTFRNCVNHNACLALGKFSPIVEAIELGEIQISDSEISNMEIQDASLAEDVFDIEPSHTGQKIMYLLLLGNSALSCQESDPAVDHRVGERDNTGTVVFSDCDSQKSGNFCAEKPQEQTMSTPCLQKKVARTSGETVRHPVFKNSLWEGFGYCETSNDSCVSQKEASKMSSMSRPMPKNIGCKGSKTASDVTCKVSYLTRNFDSEVPNYIRSNSSAMNKKTELSHEEAVHVSAFTDTKSSCASGDHFGYAVSGTGSNATHVTITEALDNHRRHPTLVLRNLQEKDRNVEEIHGEALDHHRSLPTLVMRNLPQKDTDVEEIHGSEKLQSDSSNKAYLTPLGLAASGTLIGSCRVFPEKSVTETSKNSNAASEKEEIQSITGSFLNNFIASEEHVESNSLEMTSTESKATLKWSDQQTLHLPHCSTGIVPPGLGRISHPPQHLHLGPSFSAKDAFFTSNEQDVAESKKIAEDIRESGVNVPNESDIPGNEDNCQEKNGSDLQISKGSGQSEATSEIVVFESEETSGSRDDNEESNSEWALPLCTESRERSWQMLEQPYFIVHSPGISTTWSCIVTLPLGVSRNCFTSQQTTGNIAEQQDTRVTSNLTTNENVSNFSNTAQPFQDHGNTGFHTFSGDEEPVTNNNQSASKQGSAHNSMESQPFPLLLCHGNEEGQVGVDNHETTSGSHGHVHERHVDSRKSASESHEQRIDFVGRQRLDATQESSSQIGDYVNNIDTWERRVDSHESTAGNQENDIEVWQRRVDNHEYTPARHEQGIDILGWIRQISNTGISSVFSSSSGSEEHNNNAVRSNEPPGTVSTLACPILPASTSASVIQSAWNKTGHLSTSQFQPQETSGWHEISTETLSSAPEQGNAFSSSNGHPTSVHFDWLKTTTNSNAVVSSGRKRQAPNYLYQKTSPHMKIARLDPSLFQSHMDGDSLNQGLIPSLVKTKMRRAHWQLTRELNQLGQTRGCRERRRGQVWRNICPAVELLKSQPENGSDADSESSS